MIDRHLTPALLEALDTHPIVFLRGARQTGKSTLVSALARGRHPARYLTLDDPDTLLAATADPAGFVDALIGPVVIDEVQRAPALPLMLKRAVDRMRTPGRFLLTGSAQVLVLPALSRELVGRMGVLTLWPFSQGEMLGRPDGFIDWLFGDAPAPPAAAAPAGREEILRRALVGGFPEPVALGDERRRTSWFAAYVDTVLQRDIGSLAQVEGLAAMPRLLSLLASRSACTLNLADLSRSAGMPRSTLDRYVALLTGVFLLHWVPAWSSNLGKRLVKTPKAYVTDSGLQAHLLGLNDARLEREPQLVGPLLETFVYSELAKQAPWSVAGVTIHHFRSHNGREVDLVLEDRAGRVVGVEVKAASSAGEADLTGLRTLAELAGDRFHRGVVLYTGGQSLPLGGRLHLMPVDSVWNAAGASR